MSKTTVTVYLGVVILDRDEAHIAARRAIGDTDASQDVRATFSPGLIRAQHKNHKTALEQLSSELRAIADSVLAASKRIK